MPTFLHWIAISMVDSVTHSLNNWLSTLLFVKNCSSRQPTLQIYTLYRPSEGTKQAYSAVVTMGRFETALETGENPQMIMKRTTCN